MENLPSAAGEEIFMSYPNHLVNQRRSSGLFTLKDFMNRSTLPSLTAGSIALNEGNSHA